jgi:hypothetical protein
MRDRIAQEKAPAPAQHELSDASARGVTLNGVALSVIIAGIFFALAGLYHHFAARNPTNGNARLTVDQAPAPRLQVDEAGDLRQLREKEDVILNQYGWIGTNSNIVRIPITRAMELLVQHGLTTTGLETGKTRLDMRLEKAATERSKR